MTLDELVVGAGRIEAPPEQERRQERGKGHRERQRADRGSPVVPIAAAPGKKHEDGADERQENDN